MRTTRLLTVWGMGGGGLPNPWGVCIQGGGSAQPWGPASRGVCPTMGGLHPGGLPNPGGLHPGGLGRPPPPVNRMTHKCKYITLPKTSFAGGNKNATIANFILAGPFIIKKTIEDCNFEMKSFYPNWHLISHLLTSCDTNNEGNSKFMVIQRVFWRSLHNTRMRILPTSFWLCHSKCKWPLKSPTLKGNPFCQLTSNFTFTYNFRSKKSKVGIKASIVNFVCFWKCR